VWAMLNVARQYSIYMPLYCCVQAKEKLGSFKLSTKVRDIFSISSLFSALVISINHPLPPTAGKRRN